MINQNLKILLIGLAEKLNEILPKTLKVYCDAIVRGGKWSLLEPHSLSIALLDWTIKQKGKIEIWEMCAYLL